MKVARIIGPSIPRINEAILQACIEDQRYDRQCESSRIGYMMHLVELTNLVGALLVRLASAIEIEANPDNRLHQFRMLGRCATAGYDLAWEVLVRHASESDDSAIEAISGTGARGLEWIVDNYLAEMPIEEKWRISIWLEETRGLTPRCISALGQANAEYQQYSQTKQLRRREPRLPTYHEAITSIQRGTGQFYVLKRIAESLTEAQVREVAILWLDETNYRIAHRYQELFELRAFPLSLEEIASRVRGGRPPVFFEEVLSSSADPLAREIGLELIEGTQPDWRGYKCLLNSFLAQDIPAVIGALDKFLNESIDNIHRLGSELIALSKAFSSQDAKAVLEWVYEHTPCSACRGFAVSQMSEAGVLPDRYRAEIIHDADSLCRSLSLLSE